MNEVKAGDGLRVKPRTEMLPADFQKLEELGIDGRMNIWVTHVDEAGISLHVVWGPEGFIPKGAIGTRNWQAFFSPSGLSNSGWRLGKHYKKLFPI